MYSTVQLTLFVWNLLFKLYLTKINYIPVFDELCLEIAPELKLN